MAPPSDFHFLPQILNFQGPPPHPHPDSHFLTHSLPFSFLSPVSLRPFFDPRVLLPQTLQPLVHPKRLGKPAWLPLESWVIIYPAGRWPRSLSRHGLLALFTGVRKHHRGHRCRREEKGYRESESAPPTYKPRKLEQKDHHKPKASLSCRETRKHKVGRRDRAQEAHGAMVV